MATVKIKFRQSTVDGKEGTLYFQVIHKRVARAVFTGCHVFPREWDNASSSVIIGGTEERKAYLEMVSSKLKWSMERFSRIIAETEKEKTDYSVDDIVSEYNRQPDCPTFFTFIRSMVAKKTAAKRYGTAKTYSDSLASFSSFRNGKDITFDNLNEDVINQYEAWMKNKGLKRNSSSCYLRTFKTLYLKAVELGLTDDRDIFRHVFTGFATTTKRAISIDAIKAIRKLKFKDGSPLAFARDMFMLSLYLQGMAFVDIAYLKKSDIRNGQLQYLRKKTGQALTISWEKPMQEIVDAYSHLTKDTPYFLKKIGEMAGLHIPLTTYVARHSWASIMRDMGNDITVVGKGLGHSDIKTTQIYLSTIDNSTVMKANKRFLGRILK